MRNAGLEEVQAGIKIARRNIKNLRYADDTTLMAECIKYQPTSTSALLTMPKPLTVWITINCGNSKRDGNTRPPDLPLQKPECGSGSNS